MWCWNEAFQKPYHPKWRSKWSATLPCLGLSDPLPEQWAYLHHIWGPVGEHLYHDIPPWSQLQVVYSSYRVPIVPLVREFSEYTCFTEGTSLAVAADFISAYQNTSNTPWYLHQSCRLIKNLHLLAPLHWLNMLFIGASDFIQIQCEHNAMTTSCSIEFCRRSLNWLGCTLRPKLFLHLLLRIHFEKSKFIILCLFLDLGQSLLSSRLFFSLHQIELAILRFPYDSWGTPFQQLKQVVEEPSPQLPADRFSPEFVDFTSQWCDSHRKMFLLRGV